MKKETRQSVIQAILRDYIGDKKAVKIAKNVYEVMESETKHIHSGKRFFVNEDENGTLVLSDNSIAGKIAEKILRQYLDEEEVQECLEQIITKIQVIKIEGSDSKIYSELLKHTPSKNREEIFLEELNKAIEAKVQPFKVPVCDPSIDENDNLQFIPGCKPAVGYSYYQLEKLAENNGTQLGTKEQYILFSGTIIYRLMEEGMYERDAFKEVCYYSTKLGQYKYTENLKDSLKITGSGKIAGKCDLVNTSKVLKKDEKYRGFWIASSEYNIARTRLCGNYDEECMNSVGWYVF